MKQCETFRMIRSAVLIIGAFAALQTTVESRIVNGKVVEIRDYPHQVALLEPADPEDGQFCGGSIVAARWVLTAGHCVWSLLVSQVAIRAGSSYHARGGQLIAVTRKVIHPDYNNVTFDRDYALLNLAKPLTLNDNVAIANLVGADDFFQPGTVCTVSGWGMTLYNGPAHQLRAVDVPIADHDRCRRNYDSKHVITSFMLCAGYDAGGKDACLGDSGGPLTCSGKVAGIVSVGWGCAARDLYGIYADIAQARDWIQSQINT
ncbi:trypsin-1-like [Culex pipiens pallens]|uniref:trypsin-1-like n=1 Tax=Culex pipiens pallens TaxID=42434 RepID=UPI00195487E0|nr:trypsin-1-like [Culex pipiens pallens]XP_052564016.1 trypsin-1-like [Culex pipiens pallens]